MVVSDLLRSSEFRCGDGCSSDLSVEDLGGGIGSIRGDAARIFEMGGSVQSMNVKLRVLS